LVHWPLIGGLLHLVQRGGAWTDSGPAQSPPCCTKCLRTIHIHFVLNNGPNSTIYTAS